MKQGIQLFTNQKKSFVFCDYNWQISNSNDGKIPNVDVYFKQYNGIYLWECGFNTGDKLAQAYQVYGEEFPEHVRPGDSSFVLYDSTKEIIVAARDFMGNYPLYYYTSATKPGFFIFSFSINALLESKLIDVGINYAKVIEYIDCNLYTPPTNYTFYQSIYRILPAYILRINQGKIEKLKRYGTFDLTKYQSFTDGEFIDQFRNLFIKSVKKQTDAYKKVAASLSGGLDSSSVCSVAQSLKDQPIYTFNFKPDRPEAQEDDYIDAVVNKSQTIHRTIQPSYSGYDAIKKITELNGQPFFVLNHTIQLDNIEAAKQQGCDVFLSGHWGDQVVGYGTEYIDELADNENWKALKKAIEQYDQTPSTDQQLLHFSSSEKQLKTRRVRAIRILWTKIKTKKQWNKVIPHLWALSSYFDCTVADFLTIAWQRITTEKQLKKPEIKAFINPELLAEAQKITWEQPAETLDIKTTITGPASQAQKRHLAIIFKGNQTYGQEEFFEVYRQNSLRSAQPFFDAELLELCLNVPSRIKFDEGRNRGTLRKALKDYLPELVANRVSKAIFTNHYVTLFKDLWKEFDANTPDNHPIWKIVSKDVFIRNVNIVLDDRHYSSSRHMAMPTVMRIMNLAVWLDYLDQLKK
ncbi:asparagine synthase-related protein [Spirosoma sp. KNUC1025]|uniref:asparagine synthase-related protein n=1 Tax=Spirosoma sp. KNUC1025 TaxID=2894082 RepID=UPI003863186B|nr:hypothetical protein LN737_12685 [Spirosoma sp. KNUC1025]